MGKSYKALFFIFVFFIVISSLYPQVGTWTTVRANPFDSTANNIMLLTDGSVIVQGGNDWHTWFRLTPDATGSYVNGTWSQLASSLRGRLYYPSFILADGRMFIAGGEFLQDADGNNNATEIYNPVTNTWLQGPDGLFGDIADTGAAMLADGRPIISHRFSSQNQIYNPATNTFIAAASSLSSTGDEASWQTLADGTVFDAITIAQRYLPSSNQWIATAQPPFQLTGPNFELGPFIYLQNGKVFCLSEQSGTAFFTPPTTLTGLGSWTVGPSLPNGDFAGDTPGAIEPNGKVMIVGSIGTFGPVDNVYEYDPVTNMYSVTNAPVPSGTPSFTLRMLVLPNGQIMLYAGSALHVYTPVGGPQSSWRPTITNIMKDADGSYTLTGTQLNGRSWGASYGDDAMSSTNYPIVYLKGSGGTIFYARSFNFSTMGIWTGNTPVSCRFTLPPGIPNGNYQVNVSANGISSASRFMLTVNGATSHQIDCGGSGVPPFVADSGFTGGSAASTTHPIDTSFLNTPIPPQEVLQSERHGTSFSYLIGGFVPGSFHTVTCFFSENTFNARGQRIFNVTINGTPFLTNFDIINNTQAMFKSIQQNFGIVANSNGEYMIQFTGVVNDAKVDAIQIIF